MINRFSEDIDLVVLRREEDSNNRLTTKIRTIGAVMGAVLPEVQIDGAGRKFGQKLKSVARDGIAENHFLA